MMSDTPCRDQRIDLVKTVAIWNVVLCHVAAAPFSGGTVGTTPWFAALFWTSLAHACVPLFFMASGALLLKPEKELTLKKLYTRNLPRILAALFFWALCYKLVYLALMDSLTLPDVTDAVKHLLLFHHEEHFYYLHITILAYAALPVTRLVARYADRRLLEYALALWFLLGILYPTVRTFWPFTLLSGVPVQSNGMKSNRRSKKILRRIGQRGHWCSKKATPTQALSLRIFETGPVRQSSEQIAQPSGGIYRRLSISSR